MNKSFFSIGGVLLAVGYALRAFPGDRAKEDIIPVMGVVAVLMVIIVAIIWTIEVPVPAKIIDGEVVTSGVEAAGGPGQRPVSERALVPSRVRGAGAGRRVAGRSRGNGCFSRRARRVPRPVFLDHRSDLYRHPRPQQRTKLGASFRQVANYPETFDKNTTKYFSI